jgi:hypothetical protein
MLDSSGQGWNSTHRRRFIGGSDALIIMGDDQVALLRMWREKCGEVQPEDLSANLIIQLGLVTEQLNRHWCERNTEARPTPDHANAHKRLFVVFDFSIISSTPDQATGDRNESSKPPTRRTPKTGRGQLRWPAPDDLPERPPRD